MFTKLCEHTYLPFPFRVPVLEEYCAVMTASIFRNQDRTEPVNMSSNHTRNDVDEHRYDEEKHVNLPI